MLQGWVVIAVALAYIGLLFLVASYGDRARRAGRDSRSRLLIYPLSLAIYCTSWTFFGSVGSASRTGYEFLTIYIGPVLMIGLFAPLLGAHRAAGQGAEHHLDRRLHRRALRQGPGGGGHRRADRHRRHRSLHRAAAQGGVGLARDHHRAHLGRRRRGAAAARRHRAVRRAVDGDLRGAVRHPPHRRHRAPGRPDAGDRDRVAGQAVRLSGGRHFRHLLDVRRAGRAARGGARQSDDRRDLLARAGRSTPSSPPRCCRSWRSSCCRGNSMWRWWRTTTKARSSARAGCFRFIWC